MKNGILCFLILLVSTNVGKAQEWFSSFEVAARLAMVQDKMLFVMWEGSLEAEYPVVLKDDQGYVTIVDLVDNEVVNRQIWDRFVPVLLPEYMYSEFSDQVKETRGLRYYNRLIDDGIKIMDVNGNIFNLELEEKYYATEDYYFLMIAEFIQRYSLNTSFLKYELKAYFEEKNFATSFHLASKYVDYAVFAPKLLRPDILNLSSIYLQESEKYLKEITEENIDAFKQKVDLMQITHDLVLDKPRKVLRQLKRIEPSSIDASNEPLVSFLYFTAYLLLQNENKANPWRNKISSLNLKKAELILNSNSNIGKRH